MKGIRFKITFEGKGCVNFDSIENQKGILSQMYDDRKFDNNTLPMKKSFYERDGKIIQIPKISENALRNYIFGEQISPYDAVNENIAMRALSKWETLSRGGTLILKKKNQEYNIHKKGGFNMTDANLTNGAIPQFEIQTSNVVDPITGKRASTSMFNIETLGDTVWESEGNIDLFEIQFLSASSKHDRMFLFSDWVSSGKFQEFLKLEFGEILDPISGYFYSNKDDRHPEYGILLNKEVVETIVKNTLTSMLRLERHSRTGYIRTSSLKIQIYDDITSLDDKEDGWIDIRSVDDIENIDFSHIHCFYKKVDDDIVEEYLKSLEKMKEDILAVKKNEAEDLSIAEGS